jgi:hypothetical protein
LHVGIERWRKGVEVFGLNILQPIDNLTNPEDHTWEIALSILANLMSRQHEWILGCILDVVAAKCQKRGCTPMDLAKQNPYHPECWIERA